jgi:RHS repeat-associated protein
VDKGRETRFTYDGLSVVGDYNTANQLQASYLGGLESQSNGSASFYLQDALGSVRALSDPSGNVTGTYNYNSYGAPAPSNPSAARETFTGYQYDSTSGLYYAGARYYDPSAGRFLSEDPVGSVNAYPLANNDPANLVDAYGMQATAEYGLLLQMQANNAQCIAGVVGAIAGPALVAAAIGLSGHAVSSDAVIAAITVMLIVNGAQCIINALTSRSCGAGGLAGGLITQAFVDLTTPDVRQHILDGEVRSDGSYSGGHRAGTGFPGKSEFPSSWSDDQIIHNISDVATDPASNTTSRGGATIAQGTRDGIDIEVVIRGGQIKTGYPTNVPRNPRTPRC